MTVSTPSMPLLIPEQRTQPTVESSNADAEIRGLVAAVARGDEGAFRTLYERYHARLFRLALLLSHGDESLAQDTVQTVFVTPDRNAPHAGGEGHLWQRVGRIAR